VPPNLVRHVLWHAASSAKGVLHEPSPKVYLHDFADSAVLYEVKFFIENHNLYNEISDRVRRDIWYGLNRAKIKIPFPIRTLKLDRSKEEEPGITPDTRAALRQRPFFQALTEEQTDRVIATANYARFGRDETLIEQGAQGNSMFVLVTGSAGVYVKKDGERTHVATLHAGDYFGEMSLLTGETRTATVVAREDCDVLEVGKKEFGKIVQDNPSLLESLSEMLTQRRLEVEGILASAGGDKNLLSKKKEYKENFLGKLSSIFGL